MSALLSFVSVLPNARRGKRIAIWVTCLVVLYCYRDRSITHELVKRWKSTG